MSQFLILLGVIFAYGLFTLVSPTKACGACQRHRGRPCPRCKGTGRRFRIGARAVRRALVSGRNRRWR